MELAELPPEMARLRLVREDVVRKAKLQVLFDDAYTRVSEASPVDARGEIKESFKRLIETADRLHTWTVDLLRAFPAARAGPPEHRTYTAVLDDGTALFVPGLDPLNHPAGAALPSPPTTSREAHLLTGHVDRGDDRQEGPRARAAGPPGTDRPAGQPGPSTPESSALVVTRPAPPAGAAETRRELSALAAAVLAILESERQYPPLSAAVLARVLHVTGFAGGPVTILDVEATLAELMAAGRAERVWSRGAARYRVLSSRGASARQRDVPGALEQLRALTARPAPTVALPPPEGGLRWLLRVGIIKRLAWGMNQA